MKFSHFTLVSSTGLLPAGSLCRSGEGDVGVLLIITEAEVGGGGEWGE